MLPLEGVRVIDWTIWQQGPVASALLADLGAEAIKVEERWGGDPGRGLKRVRGISTDLGYGRNFYLENNNRGKKSIAVDLKKDEGKEIIYRLVEKSDVFVQNFRQGVAERLSMDYKTLKKFNERLIYARASGYGPRGPDSASPAFDYLGLARSGIMFAIGEPDMPPLGIVGGVADQMGAVMLAFGIIIALFVRERTGKGQEVDVSHLGSMIYLQQLNVAASLLLGRELPRQSRKEASNPLWNHYRCKDGKWIALAHLQPDRYWGALCKALGIEELEKDPRFENMEARERHARELIEILDRVFAEKTSDEWKKILREKGDFIFEVIQSVSDLKDDPQALENEYIIDYSHPVLGDIKLVGLPFRFSETPGKVRNPAPEFGEHTEEVLINICGYSWDDIERLKAKEVIP